MEAQERQATSRQLAYIERLSMESGATVEKPLAELTSVEASELISELLHKANLDQNGKEKSETRQVGVNRKNDFGSGARLGMAFKCCYRRWTTSGKNIFRYRDEFMKNVIDTYGLINEIAEKAMEKAAKGVFPF
jgi:hypothetical protein